MMELTSAAAWLNETFAAYDQTILSALHTAAEGAGVILTPCAKMMTLLGEKGLLFFVLSALLICFRRTRKIGICIFGAVCCGALFTNILLKDAVARPRPFESMEMFHVWWQFIGAPAESGFSFPSGHVTAAAAGMVALMLAHSRRWIVPGVLWTLCMAASRNYLMAHYPSDVLAAMLIGAVSACIAYGITCAIYAVLTKYRENHFCRFVLRFDLAVALRRK